MSDLFSRIYSKAVTIFNEGEAEWNAIRVKIESIPGVKPVEDAVDTAIKQQLSNALSFASNEFNAHFADAASMGESAVDTFVMSVTHGLAAPGLPLLNGALTMGEDQLVAVIRYGFAEARAKLNLPPPTSSAAPSLSGPVQAGVGALGPNV